MEWYAETMTLAARLFLAIADTWMLRFCSAVQNPCQHRKKQEQLLLRLSRLKHTKHVVPTKGYKRSLLSLLIPGLKAPQRHW